MTMESATTRLPRLLSIVPWLVNRQGIDIELAAGELGVSVEQLRADLELLFLCGYGPMTDELIDVSTDGGRIVINNADTIAAPLRLSRAEALALMVGLRALRQAEGVTDASVVERALAKLEEATANAGTTGGKLAAVLDDASAEEIRQVVAEAVQRRRRLRLTYLVPARDEATRRDVDPMRLASLDGHWYLEGWCHLAAGTRLFRLDRIEEAVLLDVDGTPPVGAAARDLSAGTFVPDAAQPLVTLALHAGWEWVAEYYPIEGRRGAEPVTITLRVADPAWVRRLALRSGGGVAVLDPPALAAEVARQARAALAAYEQDAP